MSRSFSGGCLLMLWVLFLVWVTWVGIGVVLTLALSLIVGPRFQASPTARVAVIAVSFAGALFAVSPIDRAVRLRRIRNRTQNKEDAGQ
jgi:hypothetical protein